MDCARVAVMQGRSVTLSRQFRDGFAAVEPDEVAVAKHSEQDVAVETETRSSSIHTRPSQGAGARLSVLGELEMEPYHSGNISGMSVSTRDTSTDDWPPKADGLSVGESVAVAVAEMEKDSVGETVPETDSDLERDAVTDTDCDTDIEGEIVAEAVAVAEMETLAVIVPVPDTETELDPDDVEDGEGRDENVAVGVGMMRHKRGTMATPRYDQLGSAGTTRDQRTCAATSPGFELT